MLVLLILVSILDLLVAVVLVQVSGFIFGHSPEGMKDQTAAALIWWLSFLWCLAGPVAGFILRRRRLPGWGVLIAAVPTLVAVVLLVV